ncbi:MAG: LruC domain-containing protein, partial [Calditrichota bacterium]
MRHTPIKFIIALLICLFALFTACGDHVSDPGTGGNQTTDLDAPDDFDFDSRNSVRVVFRALSNGGTPLDLVRCNVYTSREDRENGENHIMQGFTNSQGTFATEVPVGNVDSVFLKFNYVGSINQAEAATNIGDLIFTLGQGVNGKRGKITSDEPKERNRFSGKSKATAPFRYLGTWNANGLPDYLASPVEVTQGELDTVNLFIPQGVSMTREFPQYFSSGIQNNINLLIDTPLYLTFLHQDTGQDNVFCYFTYPTNNPPESTEDIDSLTVVFPHAHFASGLQVGDRVKLGDFEAGTSVGFAVIRNGWNGEAPTIDGHTFYTFDEFNPEPEVDYQHFILVNDADYNFRSSDDRLLMSCEDNFLINPDWHNYDDLIFYITSDKDAIDKTDIADPPVAPDCDGDGVPDYRDAFPCDENRALIIEWGWETVAFEDDWPTQGDLDFNDLVVTTKYVITCDWSNLITDIQAQ